jgi:hypothetical protein
MTQLDLVTYNYNDLPVFFQPDGYLNATQIAKQFGKLPKDYLKNDRTNSYISAVSRKLLIEQNQLVIVKSGSSDNGGGTWLHPKLAIDFARWLDVDFSVWCDDRIEELLNKGIGSVTPQTPTDYLEALEALVTSEKEKRLALANQAKAERAVVKLNTIIDNDFGHSSILRAAKFLGIKETIFSWRVLKETTLGLDLEVKRVPSPRYGYQNLYPIRAFQLAYPEYDFNELKPESHEDKSELAFIK